MQARLSFFQARISVQRRFAELNSARSLSRCQADPQHRSKLIMLYHLRRSALSLRHQSSHAHGNKRGRTKNGTIQNEKDKHFILETKTPRTDCSGPQNPSFLAARSMLS